MGLAFLDTSALMKLYITEIGSNWLKIYVKNNQIAISELALYEGATVLRRRFLENSITHTQALALYARLQNDSTGFDVLELGANKQLERVVNLVFNQPGSFRIRALDSIHLAAAQAMHEALNLSDPPVLFVFVSSDLHLLAAAQTLGFNIENPENHP
jgi:predicted nucleic acid-binding protein